MMNVNAFTGVLSIMDRCLRVEWLILRKYIYIVLTIVYTFRSERQNKDVYMVALRDGGRLIGYYEKHEYRNVENMKQYDLW